MNLKSPAILLSGSLVFVIILIGAYRCVQSNKREAETMVINRAAYEREYLKRQIEKVRSRIGSLEAETLKAETDLVNLHSLLQSVSKVQVPPLVISKSIDPNSIMGAKENFRYKEKMTNQELKALPQRAPIEAALSARLNVLFEQQQAVTELLKAAKPIIKPVVESEAIKKAIRYCDSEEHLYSLLGRPSNTKKGSRQRSVSDMQDESLNRGYKMGIEEFAERSSQNVPGWQYFYTLDALKVRITNGNPYIVYDSLTVTAYEDAGQEWKVQDIHLGKLIVD